MLTAPGLQQRPSLALQVAQVAATIVVAEGSRHRARLSANALAHGFPASGEREGSSCVVK